MACQTRALRLLSRCLKQQLFLATSFSVSGSRTVPVHASKSHWKRSAGLLVLSKAEAGCGAQGQQTMALKVLAEKQWCTRLTFPPRILRFWSPRGTLLPSSWCWSPPGRTCRCVSGTLASDGLSIPDRNKQFVHYELRIVCYYSKLSACRLRVTALPRAKVDMRYFSLLYFLKSIHRTNPYTNTK